MIKNFFLICLTSFYCSVFAGDKALEGFNIDVKETLVKGKKVWISPFKGIGVITLNLCFKNAGGKLSPHRKEILAGLLSRAFGETTQLKTRDQILDYSRDHNVHISFSSDDDNFFISGQCPPEKLSVLFSLIKEIFFQPKFAKEDLDRFKQETAASILQAMQSPESLLDQLIKQNVLKGHPYGVLTKTYLQSIPHITPEDLATFVKKNFTKENLIIAACGDIDEEKLVKELGQFIEKLPEKFHGVLPKFIKVEGPFEKLSQKYDVPQTPIMLLHEGIDFDHPDFIALHVAMACLAQPFIGVLWQKIRVEKGLTYGIGAGLSTSMHHNQFVISTSTQTKSVDQTITAIKEVIVELQKTGFASELIENIKTNFLSGYKRSYSSTGHIANRLIHYQLQNRAVGYYKKLIQQVCALTPEQVNTAFKNFIKPDRFMIFTVGQ